MGFIEAYQYFYGNLETPFCEQHYNIHLFHHHCYDTNALKETNGILLWHHGSAWIGLTDVGYFYCNSTQRNLTPCSEIVSQLVRANIVVESPSQQRVCCLL